LELVKNPLLLVIELGDASQPDLSSFDRWQHDVHAVQLRKPFSELSLASIPNYRASADV
jgi:hypothetical protein